MRMYDLIHKKRNGSILEKGEIWDMIRGFTAGEIPDYQMSAMLMAIYFQGMNGQETAELTLAMAHSGDMVDLSAVEGIKVDKHSTGGVGDKTTLIAAPIAAACGVKIAKMSGRGLGHTGGTVDKLESIPGMRTELDREEFLSAVNRTGLSVISQSGNLAPADKKLYALRDVTATVESIPLIASSIMSKKLAAGSDGILLDVKTGSGAFMKTPEDSRKLAEAMVSIGVQAGRNTIALITNMDIPLGSAVGNSLEVIEAIRTLEGNGPADLTEVCLELAANMLFLAEKGSLEACRILAAEALHSGAGKTCLAEMVGAQGGDISVIEDTGLFEKAAFSREVHAVRNGFIAHIQTEECGIASMLLGAGRETKDGRIDYSAGIILHKKCGDRVSQGDVLAVLYSSGMPEGMRKDAEDGIDKWKTLCSKEIAEKRFDAAEKVLLNAYGTGDTKPAAEPLIYARIP